jgi:hypothetical protein
MRRIDGEHFQDFSGTGSDGNELPLLVDANEIVEAFFKKEAVILDEASRRGDIGSGCQLLDHPYRSLDGLNVFIFMKSNSPR